MRIDDAILSGSVVGSSATVYLTGSFTGSGHIFRADSASIADTASFTISASFAETASFTLSSSIAESSSYTISASHAEEVKDKSINYAALAGEFTGSVAVAAGGAIIDFNSGSIFNKTVTGNETLVFTNVKTGDVKTINATGGTSLAVDASTCEFLNNQAAYDGTKQNIISIIAISPSQQYATLNVTV